MKVFRKSPLGRKLVFTMMVTSSASLVIACLSFLSYDVIAFRRNAADQLNTLANLMSTNVAATLDFNDPRSANELLGVLRVERKVVAARVYSSDGIPFANYLRDASLGLEYLPAHAPLTGTQLQSARVTDCRPIFFNKRIVGYVYLESDIQELRLRERRLILFVLLLTAASTVVAFLVAILLKRVICTPILDLVETTKQVAKDKDFGIRARKHASDELGLLADSFNEMLETVERRDTDLKNEATIRARAEHRLRDNEAQLQLLLDSTAEAIYGIDLQGRCTFSNRACLRLLGYASSSDLLDKSMHDLVHHTRPDGTPYPVEQCPSYLTMQNGHETHADQETLWRADGTALPVQAWSYPVWRDKELVGGVVTFIDITDRQHAQNALQEAHAESELFINSVPSILIGLDADGRILRWNLVAASVFALRGADVFEKRLTTCGIPWRSEDMEERMRLLPSMENQTRWDDVLFEKDGEQRLLGLTVIRIHPSATRGVMFLIVGADVTDRKSAEQELRFKTAFLEAQTNATLDGILVVDENSNKLLQNRRFTEMFHIPQWIIDETDEQSLLDYVLPETKNPEEFLRLVMYIYSHKNETIRDEIEFKNGLVVDRYSAPVIGTDGTYYGRIWIFRDITERKNNEDVVRQLSLAVEQSPVSVLITDLQGKITYVNRCFSKVTAYSAEEVLGHNASILKSEQTSAAEYKQMWDAIIHGNQWRGELCSKKKNGELYWESVVISPIKDVHGNATHFLAYKEDITEKRIMESQLRQSQKLEAIGQLAAGIAHEINTPVQFIGDNTRFVKDAWASLHPALALLRSVSQSRTRQADDPDVLVQINDILEASDSEYLSQEIPRALEQSLEGIARVTKIVQAMKEFSHPGSDEKQLADINKAILTTLTVARNEWKYVSEIETFLADDLEFVPCHLGEFSQVILNLVVNSAHAIAQVVGDGSNAKGKITIRTRREQDDVIISIQDTGAGIPDEIQSRIFEPFFTTKAVGKGTGQGLALAHSTIVRMHGGRLWFDSEVGKGTTFYIRMPMAKGI